MLGFDQPIAENSLHTSCNYKRLQSESKDNNEPAQNITPVHSTATEGVYSFRAEDNPSIRYAAIRNNPMSGMTFGRLTQLLYLKEVERWKGIISSTTSHCGGGVDWHLYPHRIVSLLMLSLFNSVLAIFELVYMKIFLRREMRLAQDDDQVNALFIRKGESNIFYLSGTNAPVFILGHPRTGTTMLHSLLALDTDRFCICNTFTAGFPTAFLSFESIGKLLFAGILSKTRPMDNMPLHFDLPQEDELATCLLTGGRFSPYMSLYFMRDEHEYRKYQMMKTQINGGVKAEELDVWRTCFQELTTKIKCRDIISQLESQAKEGGITVKRNIPMQKSCRSLPSYIFICALNALIKFQSIASKVGIFVFNSFFFWRERALEQLPPPRKLLLKSPCHTGRVEFLLDLYPNAKFIYIHRDPFEVFLSGAHMASTTYGYMFLQRPTDKMLQEYIMKQGEILIGEYLRCKRKGIINKKNLFEVSFTQLTSRPYDTIESIYQHFDFASDFYSENMAECLLKECEKLKSYKRNRFDRTALDPKIIKEIQTRWRSHFEEYGYDLSWEKRCKDD